MHSFVNDMSLSLVVVCVFVNVDGRDLQVLIFVNVSTVKLLVCRESLSESFLLVTQAAEKKSVPCVVIFLDEAVYPLASRGNLSMGFGI